MQNPSWSLGQPGPFNPTQGHQESHILLRAFSLCHPLAPPPPGHCLPTTCSVLPGTPSSRKLPRSTKGQAGPLAPPRLSPLVLEPCARHSTDVGRKWQDPPCGAVREFAWPPGPSAAAGQLSPVSPVCLSGVLQPWCLGGWLFSCSLACYCSALLAAVELVGYRREAQGLLGVLHARLHGRCH